MWALLNAYRVRAKLALSILVWDLFLLIGIMTLWLAGSKTPIDPWIAFIGFLWILATAGAIWHRGGVVVDALFSAKIFGLKAGEEFTKAINVFFFIQTAIVLFFLIVPIWLFWAGYFIFVIVLIGLFTSGTLAEIPIKWKIVYGLYVVMAIILALAYAQFAYNAFSGNNFHLTSYLLADGVGKFFGLGITLIILSFMFKIIIQANGFSKAIMSIGGILILVGIVLIFFGTNIDKNKILPTNFSVTDETKEVFVASVPDGYILTLSRTTNEPPAVITDFGGGDRYLFDSQNPKSPKYWESNSWVLVNDKPGHDMKVFFRLRPGQTMADFTHKVVENSETKNLAAAQETFQAPENDPYIIKE
jgi:hypothetical protein